MVRLVETSSLQGALGREIPHPLGPCLFLLYAKGLFALIHKAA